MGEGIKLARPMDPSLLTGARDIETFAMPSSFAWELCSAQLAMMETKEAAAALKKKFNAHDVRNMRLWMNQVKIETTAVYIPA